MLSTLRERRFCFQDLLLMILKNKFLILNFRIKFLRFLLDWWRIKFIGVFVHFLETYQVPKFWIVKSYLNISDNIQNALSKKYASKNMDFLLMSFCFMMKNDHFEAPSKWENNLAEAIISKSLFFVFFMVMYVVWNQSF